MEKVLGFDIDNLLHNEFKAKVSKRGLRQKDVLVKLVKEYIKNG